MRLALRAAAIVGLTLILSPWAAAQQTSFTVSAGYSNVQFSHSSLFYGRDGGYVDGDFMWRLPNRSPVPLLVGGGLSFSGYYDFMHVPITFPDGTPGRARLESDVSLVSFEARAAAPISLWQEGGRGVFIMPKVGAGLLINDYAIDNASTSGGATFLFTHYHDGAAFDIRPGIQGGYSWGWGSAGVEVSYMAAFGDFGRLGSIAQEVRAGAFFRVRF